MKFPKIIALLLVASVLGGSACADWCALAAQVPVEQSSMPCHHQKSPAKPECAHRDFVAERPVGEPSTGLFHVTFLAPNEIADFAMPASSAPVILSSGHWPDPPLHPRTTVLRI